MESRWVFLTLCALFIHSAAGCELGFSLLYTRSDKLPGGKHCGDINLPESNFQKKNAHSVCSLSTATASDSCDKLYTYAQAKAYCAKYGMRLPTHTEVFTDEVTRGLDCGSLGVGYLNTRRIWTQSKCSETDFWTARPAASSACTARTETARVACVADKWSNNVGQGDCIKCPQRSIAPLYRGNLASCECFYPYGTRTWGKDTFTCSASTNIPSLTGCAKNQYALTGSAESCPIRGWTRPNFGDFCYSTKVYETCPAGGELHRDSYRAAETYCAGAGARLCTIQELRGVSNRENECSRMENRWIWSQTSCGNNRVLLIRGNREICRKTNTLKQRKGFRCCRDMQKLKVFCKACPPGTTSPAGSTSSAACSCGNGKEPGTGRCLTSAPTRKPTAKPTTRPTFRCGADKYEGGSDALCGDLGWQKFATVTDRTRNYDGGQYQFCYKRNAPGTSTKSAATNTCEAQGARLCTRQELARIRGELPGGNAVWSSTPCCSGGTCSTSAYTTVGKNEPNTCKVATTQAGTFCCADTGKVNQDRCFDCPSNSGHSKANSKTVEDCQCDSGFSGPNGGTCKAPTPAPTARPTAAQKSCVANEYLYGSSQTCADLGLSLGSGSNTCAKDEFNGACPAAMTFANAKSYCEAQGMRLCRHKTELRRNRGGLSCTGPVERAWLDKPCNSAGSSYFTANRLNGGVGPAADDGCKSKSSTASVVCCADKKTTGYCATCPAGSTSSAGSKGINSCSCPAGTGINSASSIGRFCVNICNTYTGATACRADSGCQWFGASDFPDPNDRCCGQLTDPSSVCTAR